ncbi:hypothetical protein PsorP6_016082 [Peronosclerospora sorghi]|uniref:Uncharacterized protein n=1 Tax=Peronosclerospora sorghi TaxID=230839 RepID=A0ACC0WNH1_9STRA|nr:hypothetical protein PsorP6_016082 [Peronosclerospora sorghi]
MGMVLQRLYVLWLTLGYKSDETCQDLLKYFKDPSDKALQGLPARTRSRVHRFHFPSQLEVFTSASSKSTMTKKEQVGIPSTTPASKPSFVSESDYNDEYVTVLTPDQKTLTPNTPNVDFDSNGLRMNEWIMNLKDADLRTAYYWWVCCCPCIPLAQLETRLGLNSFWIGLLFDLCSYTGRALFLALTLVNLVHGYFVSFIINLGLFVVCVLSVAHRVTRVRMQTRERLDITGSAKDDRTMSCLSSASVIRQIAVQLKCDQVHLGAPATLRAYHV